jgi:hypothetical protein
VLARRHLVYRARFRLRRRMHVRMGQVGRVALAWNRLVLSGWVVQVMFHALR